MVEVLVRQDFVAELRAILPTDDRLGNLAPEKCLDVLAVRDVLVVLHVVAVRPLDRIHIGPRATVGHGVVLLYGSDIGAGASVAVNSVVMKRERLTAGRSYSGCPTRLVGRTERLTRQGR